MDRTFIYLIFNKVSCNKEKKEESGGGEISTIAKKPLTLADDPMIPDTSCGGKKGSLLPLPFPILDLVHVQTSAL